MFDLKKINQLTVQKVSGNCQSSRVIQLQPKFEKHWVGTADWLIQRMVHSFSHIASTNPSQIVLAELPLLEERKQWNFQDPLLYELWIKSGKVLSYRLTWYILSKAHLYTWKVHLWCNMSKAHLLKSLCPGLMILSFLKIYFSLKWKEEERKDSFLFKVTEAYCSSPGKWW